MTLQWLQAALGFQRALIAYFQGLQEHLPKFPGEFHEICDALHNECSRITERRELPDEEPRICTMLTLHVKRLREAQPTRWKTGTGVRCDNVSSFQQYLLASSGLLQTLYHSAAEATVHQALLCFYDAVRCFARDMGSANPPRFDHERESRILRDYVSAVSEQIHSSPQYEDPPYEREQPRNTGWDSRTNGRPRTAEAPAPTWDFDSGEPPSPAMHRAPTPDQPGQSARRRMFDTPTDPGLSSPSAKRREDTQRPSSEELRRQRFDIDEWVGTGNSDPVEPRREEPEPPPRPKFGRTPSRPNRETHEPPPRPAFPHAPTYPVHGVPEPAPKPPIRPATRKAGSQNRLVRLQAGERLGAYALEDEIEQTPGMRVFLSKHPLLGVEVKILALDPQVMADTERFEIFWNEMRRAALVHHPYLLRVFDVEDDAGIPYVAEENFRSIGVDELMARIGAMSEVQALAIVRQVAQVFAELRAHGICHRDVSPAKFLVNTSGLVKLAGLGLSALHDPHDPSLPPQRAFYTAPEIAVEGMGFVDVQADIYSLGASLYHMVTGTPPFDGATAKDIYQKHASSMVVDPRRRRQELSPGISGLILHMMEKRPTARHDSPESLLEEMNSILRKNGDGRTTITSRILAPFRRGQS